MMCYYLNVHFQGQRVEAGAGNGQTGNLMNGLKLLLGQSIQAKRYLSCFFYDYCPRHF